MARHVRGLVNGVAEEVNETVPLGRLVEMASAVGLRVMAEHAAEEILHHSPPPKRSHSWVYWTLGLALLGGVGYRHSRRRPRRPTGTRGRGTASPPRRASNSVLPLAPRESVMQRRGAHWTPRCGQGSIFLKPDTSAGQQGGVPTRRGHRA